MKFFPRFSGSKDQFPSDAKLVDTIRVSLEELFFVRNPHLKEKTPGVLGHLEQFIKDYKGELLWVYFPWRNTAVRILDESVYYSLRTARNRNLISEAEQGRFRNGKVGIAGLSVGSAILHALVLGGGPKFLKIADFDSIEMTNLNRMSASLMDVGLNKIDIAARQVWELDPFAEIHVFEGGINKNNLRDFILGVPRLDIFIDEMDTFEYKVLARSICRENGIPVLMATDNGDGIILDVERFDLQPERQLFHGILGDIDAEAVANLDYRSWLQLASRLIRPESLTSRMQESLLAIGKTIPAVPQLGGSAMVGGATISLAVRRVLNRQHLLSGRYTVNLEECLDLEHRIFDDVTEEGKKTDSLNRPRK